MSVSVFSRYWIMPQAYVSWRCFWHSLRFCCLSMDTISFTFLLVSSLETNTASAVSTMAVSEMSLTASRRLLAMIKLFWVLLAITSPAITLPLPFLGMLTYREFHVPISLQPKSEGNTMPLEVFSIIATSNDILCKS